LPVEVVNPVAELVSVDVDLEEELDEALLGLLIVVNDELVVEEMSKAFMDVGAADAPIHQLDLEEVSLRGGLAEVVDGLKEFRQFIKDDGEFIERGHTRD
jgi:hypothetical protein